MFSATSATWTYDNFFRPASIKVGSGSTVALNYADPDGLYAADYHLYAVEWAPDSVKFFVDSTLYASQTNKTLTPGELWAFDHAFYAILNLEVGGSWASAPNAASFPMTMTVDYVRVYKASGT